MNHIFKITRSGIPVLCVAILTSVAALGARAANPADMRLMVGIIVEGLDGARLEQMRPHLSAEGFELLRRQGLTIESLDYGTALDPAAATALIVTGAAPEINGIEGETVYDPVTARVASAYADPAALGNFTNATLSPKALRTTTLSDEARLASSGVSVVYAVAADPETALPLAGHAGNLAMWLDPVTSNWATSTYYREMPAITAAANRTAPLAARMDTMSWTPSLAPADYPDLPEHLTRYPFRHVFPRGNAHRHDAFTASPLAAREVTKAAADLMKAVRPGTHNDGVDVLNVAYTLEPYTFTRSGENRVETLDAYVKVDAQIAALLRDIDSRVGLDHTLVWLAGTPARPRSRREDDKWTLPRGELSTRRAGSLLNIYLMAMYGNGDFVSGVHDGRIYLNTRLIEERRLDADAIRRQAAAFLTRMSGISRAWTRDAIIDGRAGEGRRRNTVAETAADVWFDVAPGYEIIDDYADPAASSQGFTVRLAAPFTPAFIMAPGIAPRIIGEPVDARRLAPTVARIMRIRPPTGASEAPLIL